MIQAAAVVYPKTEQEILDVVATAAKNNQKIKVGTKSCHSICKLVCPGGKDGIFLSTLKYSAIIAVNETAMTATVQSGIGLTTFLDTVAAKNLALPIAPYWDGLTLGGLLGTGGHGSTLFGRGSAVHDYVKSMKLVIPATAAEGYSKTGVYPKFDPFNSGSIIFFKKNSRTFRLSFWIESDSMSTLQA